MSGNLFCFGLGYSACALARRLAARGWQVSGTVRSAEKAATLARDGFGALVFDGATMSAAVAEAVAQASAVLVSVPPDEAGDPVLAVCAPALRRHVPGWLGYLSTTGIYGDHQGGWVDEDTPPAPSGPRAARRLAAEIAWQCFAAETGARLHIFRLPGIYGPGRNALDQVRAGTARRFAKPGQIFSRIHVEDLAAVLAASLAHPTPGAIYNVCDDEPALQADVVAYAAELLGRPVPPLEPFETARASLSDMALSFYRDSKRVRNARMKEALGVRLTYPTYREGLAALAAAK